MQRWVHNPDERDDIREEIDEFNEQYPDGSHRHRLADEVEGAGQDAQE